MLRPQCYPPTASGGALGNRTSFCHSGRRLAIRLPQKGPFLPFVAVSPNTRYEELSNHYRETNKPCPLRTIRLARRN